MAQNKHNDIHSFEAFGIVQLEAMVHGVPVIASDLKGVRIPVKFTKNGYIFKKENSSELADCIIKINTSKSLRVISPYPKGEITIFELISS